MIKPLNRFSKSRADIDGLTKEWKDDYGYADFKILYSHADKEHCRPEAYVAFMDGEVQGEIEFCHECEKVWVGLAGCVHDEDFCIFCGSSREEQ